MSEKAKRGIAVCLIFLACAVAPSQGRCGSQRAVRMEAGVEGKIHALVLFARFQDEEDGRKAIPGFADHLFDPSRPGSLTHFYREMSRGQFLLTGEVFPEWLTSSRPSAEYQPPAGRFGDFVREILEQADERIDLGQYDDDGPDGLPNSGDDDGYVDFVFVITHSAPPGFIDGAATGVAALGLAGDFVSDDASHSGGFVRIRSDAHSAGVGGTLQQGLSFGSVVGSMAHEFGHFLGLPDLYDRAYRVAGEEDPEEDSAGIGWWGLMGRGAQGWDGKGGPVPFCAWSLMQLGWLGRGNDRLVVLEGDQEGVIFEDVNAGGEVFLLPTRDEQEYFLVEYRKKGNSYYERDLPAEGLLIWHVDERKRDNRDERAKLVDLVCADGLYADAGHPLGQMPAPFDGWDNLDFWAHDPEYARTHGGNLGDATDPFDGVRYTDFWAASNPAAPPGISVTHIHREGDRMVADLRLFDRRRAGRIAERETWEDTVEIVGDVVVPEDGRLEIASGTVVRFGPDRLRGGRDPERTELRVSGVLQIGASHRRPALLTSSAESPRPGDWFGLLFRPSGRVQLENVSIEYAVSALRAEAEVEEPLRLKGVSVRHTLGDGVHLEKVRGEVSLERLQVRQSGETGIWIDGRGMVRISDSRLEDNGTGGFFRAGGYLECKGNTFLDNGLTAEEGAGLILGRDVFGTVMDNRFSGGTGIRFAETRRVKVSGNLLMDAQIGMVFFSAYPEVFDNRFERCGLVARVLGFSAPVRFQLNRVEEAAWLIDNRSEATVRATNNWWGTRDAEWIGSHMSGDVEWRPFLNYDPRTEVVSSLEQNAPNPFDHSTVIRYAVGVDSTGVEGPVVSGRARAVVEVRTITGGLVRRLVDEPAAPGVYQTIWDGRDQQGKRVASGMYYYLLRVGPVLKMRRLLLLR